MNDIFVGNAKEIITRYLGSDKITYTFLNINNIKPIRYISVEPFKVDGYVGVLPDANYFPEVPKTAPLYTTVNCYEYKGIKFCRYITPFAMEECFDVVVAKNDEIENLVRLVLDDSKATVEAELNYPIIHSHFEEVKKHTIDFLLDDCFRKFCETKFIKHKRGLIFEGKPGGGKSTCLKWLKKEAEKYDIKFRIFDGPQDFLENGKDEYANTDKKIFVFEDFDAFIQERKLSDEHQSANAILSSILNVIDGINETNNTITIFTTNLIKSFDSAVIRPGRIDKVFSFELPNKEDIMEFYKAYLQEESLVKTAYDHTIAYKADCDISFAVLKGICDEIHIHSYYTDNDLTEFEIKALIEEKIRSSKKGKDAKGFNDLVL